MRPLTHPRKEEMTVEGILYALADPVRVQIFMQLAAAECSQNCAAFQHAGQHVGAAPLAKSTLSQHFKVLREAGLIMSERKGVELHNRTRCAELQERFGEMVPAIAKAYAEQQAGQKKKRRKKPT